MEDCSHIKDETDSLPNINSFILGSVKEEIIDDQSYSTEDVFNSNSTPESFNVCEENTFKIKTETNYKFNVQKSMIILDDGSLETDNLPNRNPFLLGSIKEEIIDYPDSDNYNKSFNIEDVKIMNNSNNITLEIKVENDCRNISEQHSTFIIDPVKNEDNIFPITTPSLLGFIKEETIMNQNSYEVNQLFHNKDKSNKIKFENYNIGAENSLGVKKEKYCGNTSVPNSITIKETQYLVKGKTDGSTDDFKTHTGLLPVKKNNPGKKMNKFTRLLSLVKKHRTCDICENFFSMKAALIRLETYMVTHIGIRPWM